MAKEKWGEPPPKRASYDWSALAARLRARPGVWLQVFEQDRASLVVTIRAGRIAALKPEKGFSVTTRNNNKTDEFGRRCDLWIVYDPEQDEEREL